MTAGMSPVRPQIDASWLRLLASEFSAPYFAELKAFLLEEKRRYRVYPPGKWIFNAFNATPVDKVRVVILGQDPYHGEGQAHGLCFSVQDGVKQPPSLVNIFKELHDDLGCPIPSNGNLQCWADQGVLLLNATLTVRADQAASHQGKGWETFTDCAIRRLSEERDHLVFLLWGNYARAKKKLIDPSRHLILEAAHPSPLSAYNGFFGCRHFSRANAWLREHGIPEIDWTVRDSQKSSS